MKQTLKSALLLSAILFPATAYADIERACCRPQPKWYTAISTSVVFLDDVTFSHSSSAYTNPDYQTFDIGYGFSGAVGYKLFRNVRTEMELAFRSSGVDTDPGTTEAVPKNSRQSSLAFMANAYYDFHNLTAITPYIGGGIGLNRVKASRYYTDTGTGEDSKVIQGWGTAYQFMAGLTYEFEIDNYVPVDFFMGYRYFTGEDIEDKSSLTNYPSDINFSNDSSNIELGARFYF